MRMHNIQLYSIYSHIIIILTICSSSYIVMNVSTIWLQINELLSPSGVTNT